MPGYHVGDPEVWGCYSRRGHFLVTSMMMALGGLVAGGASPDGDTDEENRTQVLWMMYSAASWYVGQREKKGIYALVSVLVSFFIINITTTSLKHIILSLYHKLNLATPSPSISDIKVQSIQPIEPSSSRNTNPPTSLFTITTILKMQTQALMGRGGYNRIYPVLDRGGYNRDIKTSGISRPSNPSSLVVRSARMASDDGRGGYN